MKTDHVCNECRAFNQCLAAALKGLLVKCIFFGNMQKNVREYERFK